MEVKKLIVPVLCVVAIAAMGGCGNEAGDDESGTESMKPVATKAKLAREIEEELEEAELVEYNSQEDGLAKFDGSGVDGENFLLIQNAFMVSLYDEGVEKDMGSEGCIIFSNVEEIKNPQYPVLTAAIYSRLRDSGLTEPSEEGKAAYILSWSVDSEGSMEFEVDTVSEDELDELNKR